MLRSEIFQGRYIDGTYANIALETLNLGHNDIHSLDRYLFQYTPNLTRLYLNNNPIEILDHVTTLALSSAINLEVRIYYFKGTCINGYLTNQPICEMLVEVFYIADFYAHDPFLYARCEMPSITRTPSRLVNKVSQCDVVNLLLCNHLT